MFVPLSVRINVLLCITVKYVVIYYLIRAVHARKSSCIYRHKAGDICDTIHITYYKERKFENLFTLRKIEFVHMTVSTTCKLKRDNKNSSVMRCTTISCKERKYFKTLTKLKRGIWAGDCESGLNPFSY